MLLRIQPGRCMDDPGGGPKGHDTCAFEPTVRVISPSTTRLISSVLRRPSKISRPGGPVRRRRKTLLQRTRTDLLDPEPRLLQDGTPEVTQLSPFPQIHPFQPSNRRSETVDLLGITDKIPRRPGRQSRVGPETYELVFTIVSLFTLPGLRSILSVSYPFPLTP